MTIPGVVSILAEDVKKNGIGLEYTGSPYQQMGEGGFIAQCKDANGKLIGKSDADAFCMVLHLAALDTSCAEASNPVVGQGTCGFEVKQATAAWISAEFDNFDWGVAVEHTERAVRPKDGYDRIDWDRSAALIRRDDLEWGTLLACGASNAQ